MFLETMTREFPSGASFWSELEESVGRRRFLQIMGASMALAGLAGCTKMPPEKIIPYVVAPNDFLPGNPLFYATSSSHRGFSKGVLAESHEGRPTKLEGNPRDPGTLGKSDIFMQAELLALYDPNRAKSVLNLGEVSTWDAFSEKMLAQSAQWSASQGEGVRLLTGRVTSTTLLSGLQDFLKLYPKAHWHSYEPSESDARVNATRLAFGGNLRPYYDLAQAEVILSLDDDFLGPGPVQERYCRDFMSFRKPISQGKGAIPRLNRLYMIESSVSITGASADHRWPMRRSAIPNLAYTLAKFLEVPGLPEVESAGLTTSSVEWLQEIAADLKSHAGHSLVVCGADLSPETQALVFAINESLGNIGKSLASIAELSQDMAEGHVRTLIVLSANPVYDTPATLRFEDGFRKVPLRIHYGISPNETSVLSHFALPESHFLESWGDGRSYDGTVGLIQPLISPLYDSRTMIEVIAILLGLPGRSARQAVQETLGLTDSKSFEEALQDGFLRDTAYKAVQVQMKPGWASGLKNSFLPSNSNPSSLEAVIRPDPTIGDGRYSNNAWLQELPKPLLQLTWGNALLLSPATAKRLELQDEDEVQIRKDDRTVRASILRMPGHADNSATLYLGYGRSSAGDVGNNLGYNAYSLQDHRSPFFINDINIIKLGTKAPLATTHSHSSMEGRDLVVHGSVQDFLQHPDSFVKEELKQKPPTLLADRPSPEEAWAMVIDLSTCIGCNACAIACQAENNIPVVGKDQVRAAREMHWIRVDRYFQGDTANPQVFFQPVPCMHCEKAPCEEVCPTAATNHSRDGLNQMIYNRCVGTRYCSNNCPYKVRRFNFFQYSDVKSRTAQLMHNPDVTVRSRGVMEKCTYCIQRIQSVRIEAEKEDRPIRDGEILTACQQACPTNAIFFGDQNNSKSRVSMLKALPQQYRLLNDLGTLPRTTYLAMIRNPNPRLPQHSGSSA
jgi:molybdopterin-containing oxidoreductase family iron-sulfur binding subunit